MKKLFQIIGVISLMGISFFYTEKTVSVVKEYDDIMIEIKNNQNKYYKKYVNASINKDTIIPGISGRKVNINKSYSKMKRYGKYNESLIVIEKIKPKISVENSKKYIIKGNKKNKNISIVFIDNNIDDILNILDKKNIKATFLLSNNWIEKNTNYIPILIKEKHIIGLTTYNKWGSDIIKKIGNQKNIYCFTDKKNKILLNKCDYTFLSNIIDNHFYEQTKNNLYNGSILVYNVNNTLKEELPIIINYIKSRGYNIVNLEKLFTE